MRAGPLARLQRLSPERRHLLLTAAVLLGKVSLAVAVLPFRSAIRFGCVPVQKSSQAASEEIVWAVETAARWLPWRIVCIHKGLAAQRMLRSTGANAILNYGARNNRRDDKLEAHVWVTVGERVLIGGEEAEAFAPVATYP